MKFYKNNKGQIVGRLPNDKKYRKEVDSRKHKLKIMDAYGIDKYIVEDLRNELCTEIRIRETDTGKILSISMEDFLEHCVTRIFDGEQMFVSVKYFTDNSIAV